MRRRRKISLRKSRRLFKRTAAKVHRKNLPGFKRGGIAL